MARVWLGHGKPLRNLQFSRVWTEWAAKRGVSETIAAALYLLSENRKAEDVVGTLPAESGRSSTSMPELQHGEFVALLGLPAAGKTTILRMIGGLEEATEGKIFIAGRDVTGSSFCLTAGTLWPAKFACEGLEDGRAGSAIRTGSRSGFL